MAIYLVQLVLPEGADTFIEAMLAATCPAHPFTTLDGGDCPMCELDELIYRLPTDLDDREIHMLTYHPHSETDPCLEEPRPLPVWCEYCGGEGHTWNLHE